MYGHDTYSTCYLPDNPDFSFYACASLNVLLFDTHHTFTSLQFLILLSDSIYITADLIYWYFTVAFLNSWVSSLLKREKICLGQLSGKVIFSSWWRLRTVHTYWWKTPVYYIFISDVKVIYLNDWSEFLYLTPLFSIYLSITYLFGYVWR